MEDNVQNLLSQALKHLEGGAFTPALESFERIIEQAPNEAIGHIGKAVALVWRPGGSTYRKIYEEIFRAYKKTRSPQYEGALKQLINDTNNKKEEPLLVLATLNGSLLACECLIAMGADVNIAASNYTPIVRISFFPLLKKEAAEKRKIAELLIGLGADCSGQNPHGIGFYNKNTDPIISKMIERRYPSLEKKSKSNFDRTMNHVEGPGLFGFKPSKEEKLGEERLKQDAPHLLEEMFYCVCANKGVTEDMLVTKAKLVRDIASWFGIPDAKDFQEVYRQGQAEVLRRVSAEIKEFSAVEEERLQKKRQQWNTDEKAHEFYEKCKAKGITEISSPANAERIKLIATQMGCPLENDIRELFLRGQKIVDAEMQAEQEEKAKEQRILDQQYEESISRYVGFIGREKMVQMCKDYAKNYRDQLSQLKQQERDIRNGGEALYQSGKQREGDWALMGGIASGIAGGAAGLAVASDVQRRNEGIRASNEALLNSTAHLMANLLPQMWEKQKAAEKEITKWEEKAEAAETKLVEQVSEEELLSKLAPKVSDITVKKSGAVYLKVETKEVRDVKIYETVSAVIDGTIAAKLLLHGEVVGTAYLTFPYEGSSRRQTLEGICRSTLTPVSAKEYQVEFYPHHLWAIEK